MDYSAPGFNNPTMANTSNPYTNNNTYSSGYNTNNNSGGQYNSQQQQQQQSNIPPPAAPVNPFFNFNQDGPITVRIQPSKFGMDRFAIII